MSNIFVFFPDFSENPSLQPRLPFQTKQSYGCNDGRSVFTIAFPMAKRRAPLRHGPRLLIPQTLRRSSINVTALTFTARQSRFGYAPLSFVARVARVPTCFALPASACIRAREKAPQGATDRLPLLPITNFTYTQNRRFFIKFFFLEIFPIEGSGDNRPTSRISSTRYPVARDIRISVHRSPRVLRVTRNWIINHPQWLIFRCNRSIVTLSPFPLSLQLHAFVAPAKTSRLSPVPEDHRIDRYKKLIPT